MKNFDYRLLAKYLTRRGLFLKSVLLINAVLFQYRLTSGVEKKDNLKPASIKGIFENFFSLTPVLDFTLAFLRGRNRKIPITIPESKRVPKLLSFWSRPFRSKQQKIKPAILAEFVKLKTNPQTSQVASRIVKDLKQADESLGFLALPGRTSSVSSNFKSYTGDAGVHSSKTPAFYKTVSKSEFNFYQRRFKILRSKAVKRYQFRQIFNRHFYAIS